MEESPEHIVQQHIELAPELAQVLERVQQVLLQSGYSYLAGHVESWPFSPVIMEKNERALLLYPWWSTQAPDILQHWQAILRQIRSSGLLLIGTDDVDNEVVSEFFRSAAGVVVYVDARTLRFRVSASSKQLYPAPDALRNDRLAQLLDPNTAIASGAGSIDCRMEMRAQMDSLERARQAYGDSSKGFDLRKAWLSYLLIFVCVAVFLLTFVLDTLGGRGNDPVTAWGILYGPFVHLGQWWRIITSAFLHGGIAHIAMNMFGLYVLAVPLEQQQGRWRLAALYFFSVILGSLFSLMWFPLTPSLGASGGLFGLVGVNAAVILRCRDEMPVAMRKSMTKWLTNILLMNAVFVLLPQINWLAHVGGLVGGFLLGMLIIRSPFRETEDTPKWTGIAVAALLLATVLFGLYAIGHIPPMPTN